MIRGSAAPRGGVPRHGVPGGRGAELASPAPQPDDAAAYRAAPGVPTGSGLESAAAGTCGPGHGNHGLLQRILRVVATALDPRVGVGHRPQGYDHAIR